ncbi:MAG: hypothetical protein WA421_16985 [Nitrososphaeraceae archaeon]
MDSKTGRIIRPLVWSPGKFAHLGQTWNTTTPDTIVKHDRGGDGVSDY